MTDLPSKDIVRAYGKLEELESYRIKSLARVVYSQTFELCIGIVIAINAMALALLTFPNINPETKELAVLIDTLCLYVYFVELSMRIISYGKKPWNFFKKGWNVFDFLVIASTPLFAGQTAVLRILRLFRLLRIFRFLPEVRILSSSLVKSFPPLLSMSALIALLLFLYGMVGHYLFGQQLFDAWGSVGAAMMSLVILLTLENFPIYLEEALPVSPLALPFLLSYVFIIVFTVLNLLIGIVLNAMDEARDEAKNQAKKDTALDALGKNIDSLGDDGIISEDELKILRSELQRLKSLSKPE